MAPLSDRQGTSNLTSYSFSTYTPPKHRIMRDEVPNHRFGYIKRRDRLVAGADAFAFQAKCTCKWKGQHFRLSRGRAHNDWETHMSQIDQLEMTF